MRTSKSTNTCLHPRALSLGCLLSFRVPKASQISRAWPDWTAGLLVLSLCPSAPAQTQFPESCFNSWELLDLFRGNHQHSSTANIHLSSIPYQLHRRQQFYYSIHQEDELTTIGFNLSLLPSPIIFPFGFGSHSISDARTSQFGFTPALAGPGRPMHPSSTVHSLR